MAAGRGAVGLAGEHARQLDHPFVARDKLGPGRRPPVAFHFANGHLGVGERGHLSQMGHHHHLVLTPQFGQRLAYGQRRFAAHAGVHLVEDQGPRPGHLVAALLPTGQ